jgi:methionyl-tRNA formyltransferase
MEEGLDSGPILLQAETPIAPQETGGELSPRLAALGARLVIEALARLERGDLAETPQDEAGATWAPRLSRDSGRADWSLDAAELANRLRAYTPWPGLTAELRGAPVKLLRAAPASVPAPVIPPPSNAPAPVDRATAPPRPSASAGGAAPAPGTLLGLAADGLLVACGGGTALAVSELQRPGKKPQRAADFVNGERLRPGERFS